LDYKRSSKKLEETGYKTKFIRTLNKDGEVIGWHIKINIF